MAVLVDPPQRGSADERSARTDPLPDPDDIPTRSRGPGTVTAARPVIAEPAVGAPPKLAEPPIPGGRVEALMGVLIRVLSHSPLARPLPAVTLSALGVGGVAFVGLCATAPHPS